MMRWKRFVVRAISEVSALISTFREPSHGFRVLMYHAVGTKLQDKSLGIYTINPKLFEQHMAVVASYNNVSVVGFCDGQALSDKLEIAVTFDDGYKDNLYTAAPILFKYNIPFTVFVSSSFIRSNSRDFLNSGELRELSSCPGVTIGAHGCRHVSLINCNDDNLNIELRDSKSCLEDIIGKPVTTVAYPYGIVNRRVRDAAEDAGYVRGGCSFFGINDALRDPLLLRRCVVLSQDTTSIFVQKLHGDWDWCSRFRNVRY